MSVLVSLLALLLVLCIGCAAKPQAEESAPSETVEVNVAALKGPTAMGMAPLMARVDDGELMEENYHFTLAGAVDEITPLLVQGKVDIAAIPANLAAVLYNNTDGAVEVLAINTLGVLYIVENGDAVASVEDLRERTIYASGKGATPEYALNYILSENGIDAQEDVTIEWKSEHTECLSALLADPGAVALLPQPFVTTALSKSDAVRVALDLNEEWEALENGSALLTGVAVVRRAFAQENPEAVEAFLARYKESIEFVNSHVDGAAEKIGAYGIVPTEVARAALPECNIVYIDGSAMQEKLSGYLRVLMEQNGASVGGTLPGDDFYYRH